MCDFKDKIVLITGAANGIGAEISKEMLKEGAKHVRILDVDENAGVKLQDELNSIYGAGKVKFVKCDVTKDDQFFEEFKNIKEEQGYLDVMINNAGVSNEFDYAAIRKMIEINNIALVNGSLQAIEIMDKTKGGRGGTVMNMSSVAGLTLEGAPLFVYSMTKSAILHFTSCIGAEVFYQETGVRALTLCFGTTDTNIYDSMTTFQGKGEKDLKAVIARFPKQTPKSAAQGAIEAFKKGKTASVWLIHENKPALDITPTIKKYHEDMAKVRAS